VNEMPNRGEHALWGALSSAGCYVAAKRLLKEEVNPGTVLGWGLIGAVIGLSPDLLEPATNPKHRKLAHSLSVGGAALYSAKKSWDNPQLNSEQKAGALASVAAYLSHLVLDSTTPASLPIV